MYRPIKRFFDLIISLVGIILLFPVFIIITILSKIFIGGSVLFKQKRVGQYNKIFTLYKFKSMRETKNSNGELESDAKRLTKFGKILRSSSLDELPQLFNIFLGDMTIIGPRPKTIYEVLLMENTKYVYRAAIKPGLSSWSVVHGRNNLPNNKALAYDIEHVEKFSFALDVKIFFKTIGIVLKKSGINTDGHSTFLHLSDFLVQNNIKTQTEVAEIKKGAVTIEKNNVKFMPMNISKSEFKNKRKEIQRGYKKTHHSSAIEWN